MRPMGRRFLIDHHKMKPQHGLYTHFFFLSHKNGSRIRFIDLLSELQISSVLVTDDVIYLNGIVLQKSCNRIHRGYRPLSILTHSDRIPGNLDNSTDLYSTWILYIPIVRLNSKAKQKTCLEAQKMAAVDDMIHHRLGVINASNTPSTNHFRVTLYAV